MNSPKVSIALPIYNAEKFLRAALESLLAQSWTDFEILAIDDGSTDASAAILKSYQDPRLRLISNQKNLGLIETLNKAFALARGEYIARMDADDISLPKRLEMQVRYLDDHPQVLAVGTGREEINEQGSIIRKPWGRPRDPAVVAWKLLTGNCLTHSSVMLRATAATTPFYRPEYIHAEDYEAWLRLSRQGAIAILPERLLQYRVHANSVSHRFLDLQVRSSIQALREHLRIRWNVTFRDESLLLWSTPKEFHGTSLPPDFFTLVLWMNPASKHFQKSLACRHTVGAFIQYLRRLTLLTRFAFSKRARGSAW